MGIRQIDRWTAHVTFGPPTWLQYFTKGLANLLEYCLDEGMPNDVAEAILEHAYKVLSDHALELRIRYEPADE